jgi:uncharacterized protein (TIGR03083 family)
MHTTSPKGTGAVGGSIAVAALEADRAALIEIGGGLGPADWEAGSGCAGWSVQDVVAHMGALFWSVVDPSVLAGSMGQPTEQAQDALVRARRSMTAPEVLDDYTEVSGQAIAVLAGLAVAEFELALGDLGTYPAPVIASAFAFDHYVHIRCDLFPPRGPLSGAAPPSDELRLGPTLDWVEAALPQQNVGVLASLTGPVELVVDGTAGRTIRLGPAGPMAASVRSEPGAFVRWITQRQTWEQSGVVASGEPQVLEAVRRLKVF